ncbi:hypothetical protein H1R20_g10394, partial [Candolleomyces eurysporus]
MSPTTGWTYRPVHAETEARGIREVSFADLLAGYDTNNPNLLEQGPPRRAPPPTLPLLLEHCWLSVFDEATL